MIGRIAFCLAALSVALPAQSATRAIKESWGKPGVSFDAYRTDALECTAKGYLLDISKTEQADAFVRGSRELEDMTQTGPAHAPDADPIYEATIYAHQMELVRRSVRPELRMRELKDMMQAEVDQCLMDKNYVRFALTTEQQKRLSRLKIGADERRHYLHDLASNPGILERQRLNSDQVG